MDATLNDREFAIIEARFGFDGDKRTLEALGEEQGVRREQIRQIESRALKKLASGHLRRRLYDALEILGGHPPQTWKPGGKQWEAEREAERMGERIRREAYRQTHQARMLKLDAERQEMGDLPSAAEFSDYLARWAQLTGSSDMEMNAFIHSSDWQLQRWRLGMLEAGQAELAELLTPESRDEERVRLGLKPYSNQQDQSDITVQPAPVDKYKIFVDQRFNPSILN